MKHILVFLLLFSSHFLCSQTFQPPIEGPGSATYQHDSVVVYDYAQKQEGYWLFEPALPRPKAAPVVVFLHGYGGYNPMIYGQWIRHLVRQGNVVIYPRYQKTMTIPIAKKFSKNVVTAIQEALTIMATPAHIDPIVDNFSMVGHSYGGAIAAEISMQWKERQIPEPKALFLCAPGTGPLKASNLENYSQLPKELLLLVMIQENDHVVGDDMGLRIFETAVHTPRRNLIRQYEDSLNGIDADHNETYCVDKAFDTGLRNYTSKRALRITQTNAIDYYGHWKLFDALLACTRKGQYCEFAFGDTPQQHSLGLLNGQELKKLEVLVPNDGKRPLLSEKE